MNKPLAVILATVALDAAGGGLIMPILPGLIRWLAHSDVIAIHYGLLLAGYAAMQFLFSPLLGALSDRFGRRPVLLASLGGAAIDYLVMAAAPVLWLLYASRIIAGITGANLAVAGAYIADITEPADRGRRFGYISAAFGIGFIAGPVIGGWLGEYDLRAPFLAAAALNGINLLVATFVMPESRKGVSTPLDLNAVNPFKALHLGFKASSIAPLLAVYGMVAVIGQIGATLWVISGHDRFGWSPSVVGLSLAAFGLVHALAQALLTGPAIAKLGERMTLIAALIIDGGAYAVLGLTGRGRVALSMIPVLSVAGLETPALQALLSGSTDADRQGELQGLMASLTSLAGIAGPLGMATIYAATSKTMPGFVWLLGAALSVMCAPFVFASGSAKSGHKVGDPPPS